MVSCENKDDSAKLERERKEQEELFKSIDSVYMELGSRTKSAVNWEKFEYQFLYELQEFIELKKGKLTFKHLQEFEIYKKDTSYRFSYVSRSFSNDIFFDLSISKDQMEKYNNQNRRRFNVYDLVSIKIDKLEPIAFEYRGDYDYYHSVIHLDRNKSLVAYGEILDFDFYKTEKSKAEKILWDIND